ncbi:MAG: hypothetical protein AAGI01_00990 [Myxococcota bacterium]
MSLSYTLHPAPIALLRGVRRVDHDHRLPAHLRSVLDALSHQRVGPTVQATSERSIVAVLFGLSFELQVFQHEDSILACKLGEFGSHHLTRRPRAIALLLPKPFEGTAHALRVLALCLSGSEFALQSSSRLSCPLGLFSFFSPRHEKHLVVGVHRHDGVGLVQIHPNRMDWSRVLHFERHAHLTEQLPIALDDVDRVDELRALEEPCLTRCFAVAYLLSPFDSRDADALVSKETSLTARLAYEEDSVVTMETECFGGRTLVRLGAGISRRDGANHIAGHLGVQAHLFELAIDDLVELELIEGIPLIEAGCTNGSLPLSETLESGAQGITLFKDDRVCALNFHRTQKNSSTNWSQTKANDFLRTPIPSLPEGRDFLGELR